MKTIYTLLFSLLFISQIGAQIMITEISYNPPESGADSLEYIELHNAGSSDYDLTNASFSSGVEHTFANEVLAAGAYMCVCVNEQAFMNVFGKPCVQWTDGGLRNTGEAITLIDANMAELDNVEYGRDAPWPTAADGTNGNGASIVLCDLTTDNADPANWSAAKNSIGIEINGLAVKGSPSEENTASCETTPDHTIEARNDNTFAPNDITIDVGQTVRWINTGGFHNVNGDQATYPNNPESFGNGASSTDAWTYDYTFFVEGVYDYQCDPHIGLGMVGKITVGTPKTFPIRTIAEITTEDAEGKADSVGLDCQISGVVHGINISTSGGLLFWIIDENHDGISVYNQNSTLGYTVAEGDAITLKGAVGQFRGLTQFNATSIVVDGTGDLQNAIVIDSMSEDNESKLAQLQGMTFVDPTAWRGDGSSFNIEITNGTKSSFLRISEFTDLANMTIPDQPFNVTGLVNQFDSAEPFLEFYQLMPRSALDFSTVSSTFNPNADDINIYPNPAKTLVSITGIDQPEEVCLYHINGQLLTVWDNPGSEVSLDHSPGLYLMSIRKNDKVYYEKLIIE